MPRQFRCQMIGTGIDGDPFRPAIDLYVNGKWESRGDERVNQTLAAGTMLVNVSDFATLDPAYLLDQRIISVSAQQGGK